MFLEVSFMFHHDDKRQFAEKIKCVCVGGGGARRVIRKNKI